MTLRLKKRGEKALERALVVSSPEDDPASVMSKWKGFPEEHTIPEGDESSNTPGDVPGPGPQFHSTGERWRLPDSALI